MDTQRWSSTWPRRILVLSDPLQTMVPGNPGTPQLLSISFGSSNREKKPHTWPSFLGSCGASKSTHSKVRKPSSYSGEVLHFQTPLNCTRNGIDAQPSIEIEHPTPPQFRQQNRSHLQQPKSIFPGLVCGFHFCIPSNQES